MLRTLIRSVAPATYPAVRTTGRTVEPGIAARRLRTCASALLLGTVLAGCQGFDLSKLPATGDVGPVADDASPLSAQVQEALAATPATMHERIHIRAMQAGRVRLVGSVSSDGTASEAARIANAVPGVTDVLNTLNVR